MTPRLRMHYACVGSGKLSIQEMPNLSVIIPKRAFQKVSCSGKVTSPPAESAVKKVSISSGLSHSMTTAKLLPCTKDEPGMVSDAIRSGPPRLSVECRVLSRDSGVTH